LIESTFLISRPLRSTTTPDSSGFTATTGRSAGERRVGTQCLRPSASAQSLSRPWGLRPRTPYRRSPSHVPCKSRRPGSRRLHAGHRPASNTGSRQAHPEDRLAPRFRCHLGIFDAYDDARPGAPGPTRAILERLPDPHLTRSTPRLFPGRSPRRSSANAAPGRFDARPRRADAEGPASLHLSHSTAYVMSSLHNSSFSVRGALSGTASGTSLCSLSLGGALGPERPARPVRRDVPVMGRFAGSRLERCLPRFSCPTFPRISALRCRAQVKWQGVRR
jgi:hypothetical protein